MRSKFAVACCAAVLFVVCSPSAWAGTTRVARDPYVGAIVVEAETGTVLFADDADRKTYPASVVKLMDLLIILEDVEAGRVRLDDKVVVTREAARMGGSQVYLAEKEVFTVDDLLYALMMQSANDAAVALAIHVSGSKEAFVERMNERAMRLGMTNTRFQSPHGLPPSRGQQPDLTTARDVALLARAVLRRPEALVYTSTLERAFRGGKFTLRSHNALLRSFSGCDGLKTGYYYVAGFSIAATAVRDGVRVITVVLGSASSRVRDRKAADLLATGLEQARSVASLPEEPSGTPVLEILDVQ